MSFSITSPAFITDSEIPQRYTCDDEDVSPPLQWTGIPAATLSLVLIVDDPDAPDPKAPKMTWIHWLLYNLPADSNGLPEAVKNSQLPTATSQGKNSWNRTG
jgi:Raf kinase inhibitor-like YbhB/YbcL family protein